MWYLRIWFNGGLGSAGLIVEFNDLKGLLQPKWFYDSCHLWHIHKPDYETFLVLFSEE